MKERRVSNDSVVDFLKYMRKRIDETDFSSVALYGDERPENNTLECIRNIMLLAQLLRGNLTDMAEMHCDGSNIQLEPSEAMDMAALAREILDICTSEAMTAGFPRDPVFEPDEIIPFE